MRGKPTASRRAASCGTGSRVPRACRKLIEPTREQILRFCAEDPVERVFLEDVARRGLGRFVGARRRTASSPALCHLGSQRRAVRRGLRRVRAPGGTSGSADADRRGARRVRALGRRRGSGCPRPREDRPGQPVYAISRAAAAGGHRAARRDARPISTCSCRRARRRTRGDRRRPAARDPDGFRWRTRTQIEEGRSWLWVEDGVILFKAEASAWTPDGRAAPAGVGRSRGAPARATRRAALARPLSACSSSACRPSASSSARRTQSGDPAVRGDRHAARARLPLGPALSLAVKTLILARHAFAGSNAGTSSLRRPPGRGPHPRGRRAGAALGRGARRGADRRRRQLAPPAHAGDARARARRPRIPFVVEPLLDEIDFGSFEGGALAAYRTWAWSNEPDAVCPGGGETRADTRHGFRHTALGGAPAPPGGDACWRSATAFRSGTCSTRPTGRIPGRATRARAARDAVPARPRDASSGRPRRSGRGRPRRVSPIPRLVDDDGGCVPSMHTSSMTVRRPLALLAALVGAARRRGMPDAAAPQSPFRS